MPPSSWLISSHARVLSDSDGPALGGEGGCWGKGAPARPMEALYPAPAWAWQGALATLACAGPRTQVGLRLAEHTPSHPLQGPVGTPAGDPKVPVRPPTMQSPAA